MSLWGFDFKCPNCGYKFTSDDAWRDKCPICKEKAEIVIRDTDTYGNPFPSTYTSTSTSTSVSSGPCWEYKILKFDGWGNQGSWEAELNRLGAQKWELVCTLSGGVVFLFKRPI